MTRDTETVYKYYTVIVVKYLDVNPLLLVETWHAWLA